MKKSITGFTLIELLIVIVIIGILAVALIPRLTGAQGRARDVVRKAHIQQLTTALKQYEIDNGSYPSTTACIGGIEGQECRPGYIQNPVGAGGDGGTGARALGNSGFNNLLSQYINPIPIDPSPNRSVGEKYIYRKGSADIGCDSSLTIHNSYRIARQPEKTGPNSDNLCNPGKWACCSALGCGGPRFCVLQLN